MKRTIWILFILLLTACGNVEQPAPRAESITCNTAYRSDVSGPIEREDSLNFSDNDAQQTLTFTDLDFHAQYSAGEADNERSLRLWVTEAGQTSVMLSELYQLPINSGPINQFIGGHGFTGLNYIYHPDTQAELQFWCEVDEAAQ